MTARRLVYVTIALVGFVFTNLYIADLHITIRHKNKTIAEQQVIIESLSQPGTLGK